ncbi:MAG: hypothetical protein KKB70_03255, partial [Proteobacteria bacterium]|nr:hypothetical protein [Pseudomonadota bacterium]MBU1612768.1 hypothetical protein [Pseudomonadota bacterium]
DGFSLALAEDYADLLDETGRDYLMRIRRATAKAESYMQALLQVSRQTRGELNLRPINLSEEIFDLNNQVALRHTGRIVPLSIQADVKVQADLQLIRTLLLALLDNGWKFTADKDCPQLSFGQTKTEHGPAIYLKDNGVGFDMAFASDRLFRMFQRFHGTKIEGMGTGLATALRIVNRHGGSIWATAEPDQGATFFFTLPQSQVG